MLFSGSQMVWIRVFGRPVSPALAHTQPWWRGRPSLELTLLFVVVWLRFLGDAILVTLQQIRRTAILRVDNKSLFTRSITTIQPVKNSPRIQDENIYEEILFRLNPMREPNRIERRSGISPCVKKYRLGRQPDIQILCLIFQFRPALYTNLYVVLS